MNRPTCYYCGLQLDHLLLCPIRHQQPIRDLTPEVLDALHAATTRDMPGVDRDHAPTP